MKEIDLVTAIYVQLYAKKNPGVKGNVAAKNEQDAAEYLSGLHNLFRKVLDSDAVE